MLQGIVKPPSGCGPHLRTTPWFISRGVSVLRTASPGGPPLPYATICWLYPIFSTCSPQQQSPLKSIVLPLSRGSPHLRPSSSRPSLPGPDCVGHHGTHSLAYSSAPLPLSDLLSVARRIPSPGQTNALSSAPGRRSHTFSNPSTSTPTRTLHSELMTLLPGSLDKQKPQKRTP